MAKRRATLVIASVMILAFTVPVSSQTAAKNIRIKVLNYIGNEVQVTAWKNILAKYTERNPAVTFDSQSMSQTEYITQLRTRIASGDAPDIMMGQPSQYPDIIDSGYVMDISNSATLAKLKLSKGDLGDCSFKGKAYAFPIDFKVSGVFYNKDIFAKYSLSVPKSTKELTQICEILKKNGVDPWVRGYAYNIYPDIEVRSIFWPMLQDNGKYDAFEKLMTGKAKFSDYPEFGMAMKQWTDRMAYKRIDDMSNEYIKARQIFVRGEAAMLYEGSWAVGQLYQFNPKINMDMFPMPRDDGKPNDYPYQIDKLFMVNGKSKNVAEVLKFMDFLLSPEISAYWAAVTLQPSVVPGAIQKEIPDVIREAMRAKEANQIAHAGLWTAQLYGEFNNTWRAQLQGYAAEKKFDIPKFTEKLQAAFDEIIKSLK